MFGTKRCQSVLQKLPPMGQMHEYDLSADAPAFAATGSPSPVPLQLLIEESNLSWDSPPLQFGAFTYFEGPTYYSSESSQESSLKRKLSPEASPRRSPTKKPSMQQLSSQTQRPIYHQGSAPAPNETPPFRRPSVPDVYSQGRQYSGLEYQQSYNASAHAANSQYYVHRGQTTPSLQTAQSPSWGGYLPQPVPSTTRSPSAAAMSAGSRSMTLMPSPATVTNPPLIRTSTLQHSPTTPGSSTATFNPYAVYSPNAKALLKLEGDLNSMSANWTPAEWDANRRLVEFKRSQSGSVISATFKAVTADTRDTRDGPSICVSCIYWEEKKECYVTSVDAIQLLEALVGVRFTVEEKNRIRRNLEGFRPATVSKAKPENEEFFKLIMGFPNPKPRNIEKDVKVFPWRILAGALKKIIGKYASHPRPHDASCSTRVR